jgi:hypothetical protein
LTLLALVPLVVVGAIRWDDGPSAPRGLLDDDPRSALMGLPVPASFRIVSRRTGSHGDITLRLCAARRVNAARVLADVERRLPHEWTCLVTNTRLGFAGDPDEIGCFRGDFVLGYFTADRETVSAIRVTVGTPVPED